MHACTSLGGIVPEDDDVIPDNWDATDSEEEVSDLM